MFFRKDKTENEALRPFDVLANHGHTIVILQGDIVEVVNSYRVTQSPQIHPENAVQEKYNVPKTSAQAIAAKTTLGKTRLVHSSLAHRVMLNFALELQVEWYEPYKTSIEPRTNVPEEVLSRYIATEAQKGTT